MSDTGIQLVSGADLKGAPYITALLNEPLNPALVKVHPQSKARYLDGRHYIETANRIFGYGGWQFRITERPAKAVEGTRKSGTYYALWSVVGELQAAGVTFVDLGTCEQNGEGPEAVDMASKGAVTDALKRCLRNFGDQFGLVLYDKELSYRDMAAAYSAAHGESQDVDPETGEIDATAQAGGGSAVSTRTSPTGDPDGRVEAVLNIIAHGYPEWAKDDKPLRAEAAAAALGVAPSALTRESINPTITQWLSGPGNSPATFASRFGEWFAAEQKRRAAREEVPA